MFEYVNQCLLFCNFVHLNIFLNLSILFSQVDINYVIEAKFNEKDGQIDINQNIFFKNISDNPIETIYMNDWSNSYSSTDTPLAKRFGEEYDRSFYLSSKNKLGFTKIDYIKKDGAKINWNRLSDQKDIKEFQTPSSSKEKYQTFCGT